MAKNDICCCRSRQFTIMDFGLTSAPITTGGRPTGGHFHIFTKYHRYGLYIIIGMIWKDLFVIMASKRFKLR